MGIYSLKPGFRQGLGPLAARLGGVSPNAVSLAAVVFAALAGLCLVLADRWPLLWLAAPALFFARIACNALDGLLAQSQGSGSARGEIVNEISDRLSDLLIFGSLAFLPTVNASLVVSLVAGILFISYLDVLGQSVGAGRTRLGPFGKADRMAWLGLASLAAFAFSIRPEWALDGYWDQVLLVFLLLALLTILKRLARIMKRAGGS